MTPDDFGLIDSWRQRPHVRKWWGDDEKLDEEELAHPLVRRWLVCQDNKPFAYIQDYAVQGWDFDHYFAHLPKGARGIDQYIGEPDKIGLGHGSALITQHVQTLFKEGVPVVATDPDPKNTVAIAVYQKVGFQIFGDVIASDWGPVLPMKIEA
ncbi:acetyltransferase [Cognatishimia activa]|uniref:acetyltransferase n=1 Tax=Cognatishimia activa TaxID=1715691 RepID=UPI00222EB330|nr:acetyltransferase [Cognatishimia activa]UZD92366.1 acetyltransferase [Cognatishimia activa]